MNLTNNNNYSLSLYLQNGDICEYLNINTNGKEDSNNLTNKFKILDSVINKTIFDLIFSNFIHQQIVSECSFKYSLKLINSQVYQNSLLIMYEKGYWPQQIPFIVIPALFAISSILLNISLIIVSFKKLKTNLLLPFDSFCQIFALIPFIINFIYLLFGITIINYNICFWISLISTIGSYSSFMAIFFISLERMLIVYFPLRMHVISDSTIFRIYLLIFSICLFSGGIIALTQINVLKNLNSSFEKLLLCNSGVYSDLLNSIFTLIIISLSLFNYILIFFMIIWRYYGKKVFLKLKNNKVSSTQNNDRPEKDIKLIIKNALRILRSVLIISLVLIIGWIISSAMRNYLNILFLSLSTALTNLFISKSSAQFYIISANILNIFTSILTYIYLISAGINAPILIICNVEYRNAYKSIICKLFKNKSTAVQPLFIKTNNNNNKNQNVT